MKREKRFNPRHAVNDIQMNGDEYFNPYHRIMRDAKTEDELIEDCHPVELSLDNWRNELMHALFYRSRVKKILLTHRKTGRKWEWILKESRPRIGIQMRMEQPLTRKSI